jgi:hypothetical protein
MTATLTPTVQTLIESFRNLSTEEQESFREEIAAGDGDAVIPEAHWEILMERERLFQCELQPLTIAVRGRFPYRQFKFSRLMLGTGSNSQIRERRADA